MPVTFVKKAGPVEVVEPVPVGTRPVFKYPIVVGDFSILPDIDVSHQSGKQKFLVHLEKSYWFHILSAEGGNLMLKTQSGMVFDSAIRGVVSKHYMVVAGQSDAVAPSTEVIDAVRALIKPL